MAKVTSKWQAYQSTMSERLGQLQTYLDHMRTGRSCSPLVPLWHVRVMHDASCHAGRKDITDLCLYIEQRVMELHAPSTGSKEALINELQGVVETLRNCITGSPRETAVLASPWTWESSPVRPHMQAPLTNPSFAQ